MYKIRKTAEKAINPPVIIFILAAIARAILKRQGIELDDDTVLQGAIVAYGAGVGFLNWFKHRKKRY